MAGKPKWKQSGMFATALTVALLLVVAYVCAYYATVVPYSRSFHTGKGPWHSYSVAGQRLPSEAYTFFGPIHWIDRKVRRETWWISDE